MPKVDPAPLPYGALHYYQVHYIVQVESQENGNFLAKCEPKTRVHFGNERVVEVKWTGVDGFANILQGDAKLTEMLKEVMLHEGEIRVDPQDDHIRIYGKWKLEENFPFNENMMEIADRIAMQIKERLRGMGIKA
jgi:hypothetical protein